MAEPDHPSDDGTFAVPSIQEPETPIVEHLRWVCEQLEGRLKFLEEIRTRAETKAGLAVVAIAAVTSATKDFTDAARMRIPISVAGVAGLALTGFQVYRVLRVRRESAANPLWYWGKDVARLGGEQRMRFLASQLEQYVQIQARRTAAISQITGSALFFALCTLVVQVGLGLTAMVWR